MKIINKIKTAILRWTHDAEYINELQYAYDRLHEAQYNAPLYEMAQKDKRYWELWNKAYEMKFEIDVILKGLRDTQEFLANSHPLLYKEWRDKQQAEWEAKREDDPSDYPPF